MVSVMEVMAALHSDIHSSDQKKLYFISSSLLRITPLPFTKTFQQKKKRQGKINVM